MQAATEFLAQPWVQTVLGVALLLAVAWLAGRVARFALVRAMTVVSRRTAWKWDDALVKRRVFQRLAQVLPLLIIGYGIAAVPQVPAMAIVVVNNIAKALIALVVVLAINAGLSALEDLYQASPHGKERSIKGYVQLLKIFVILVGAIIILATLIDKSPLTLLAGLGAVSAVLLLIFKDTILSVVASIQLGSNDMLRVGDWIEMPAQHADGFVIDIALHTVKVQNWDKTISTIPTWRLISDSYRNWRGMYDIGGRRIARALNIDVNSVHFHGADEIDHLRHFTLLDGYFERKRDELDTWNRKLGAPGQLPINQRRLSNLGSFRAYVQAYIDAHPGINHEMLCAARQLDPGPEGIPLQIYAYSAATDFVPYNNLQGDIFDHLVAILPEFGLRLFQQPTGTDMRDALGARGAAPLPVGHADVHALRGADAEPGPQTPRASARRGGAG